MALDPERYKEQVETLAAQRLRPYVSRLRAHPPRSKYKDVNDAVWHTIALLPLEVLVLDSPLLQRLRGIRQLGVAHWTYPSALHSRLEHSLGALHMVQRLFDSFSRQQKPTESIPPLPREWQNLLRLAALCHDVGHGFMSHVSENALDAVGVVADLKLELADFLGCERVSLAEAASHFLLASDPFQELLDTAIQITGHSLPTDHRRLLPKLVLGLTVHDRYPLLQELISGPFDADKLDYMTRDAVMSGIPVVTDIPRLANKVRLLELSQAELPERIAGQVEAHKSYYVQAIAMSGARVLDELMIGRTLLFDKIYRHQKVRVEGQDRPVRHVVGHLPKA